MVASELWIREPGKAPRHPSRQRVSILRQQWKKATAPHSESGIDDENASATDFTEASADELHRKSFVGLDLSAPQPALSGNALERQRLVDLAPDDQLATMIDKILRGSAPRAAAIAVGITSHQFGKRMESDATFKGLVLRAAHEAESSVAQNLYRMAVGNSPQAAQSAIAWLNARVPDDWSPNRQKINIEVSGRVDVTRILSDERLIELESELEARRQQIEDGVIEGEFRQLPSHDEVPPLPEGEFDHSGPTPIDVRPWTPVSKQAQGGDFRPTQFRKVDGIETEVVDERGPSSDSGGGMRIVG
jgi:hypothetical protein